MSARSYSQWPARAPMRSRTRGCGVLAARQLVTLALALLTALLLLSRPADGANVALVVNIAPPPLPVYEQPPLPSPGPPDHQPQS